MNKQRVLVRALCFVPGLGPVTILKILKLYPDLEQLWRESNYEIAKKLNQNIANKITNYIHSVDCKNLEKNNDPSINYVTILDNEYPNLLKEIYDPPIILYYRGNLTCLKNEHKLAVVGARKISSYAQQIMPKLLSPTAEQNITIVSGLAIGVDSLAHQIAIQKKQPTIAVLGGGLDDNSIYPKQNINLMQNIIKTNGIIISEYAPNTKPIAENFPRRNRIISGLSQATLIIEAAKRSGSLITAYQALEQNREVMAVPGSILLTNSLGTNKLLQRGAKLITQTEDILATYSINPNPPNNKLTINLTLVEKTILNLLQSTNLTVDNLQQSSKMDIVQLNATLSTMEVKGLIKSSGGTYYSI